MKEINLRPKFSVHYPSVHVMQLIFLISSMYDASRMNFHQMQKNSENLFFK